MLQSLSFENMFSTWTQFHTNIYMGKSFQDYSWIQVFEADFPQKVSLKIPNKEDHTSLSEDNWPFELKIVNI